MNRVTKNRGPDDTGVYIDDNVSLGHNRLSIIDLSEKGHQPMCNEDGTIWITYNGEIYNFRELKDALINSGHKFKSNTDTEVILHAYEEYGMDMLKKFNGMWAFCIYDKKNMRLVLSRDQFGIKPLYYYINGGAIIFSSMIAGIRCHDIKTGPNNKVIMEYLAYNLEDYGNDTFFTYICSLARDSYLVYDLATGSSSITKWYYHPTKPVTEAGDVKRLFIESVRYRTISDVPIGSCLSGGIDSSSIVCALDRLLKDPFYTFSFVAPGNKIDERRFIEEVGRNTKTKQFFTVIDTSDFLSNINDFIIAQEEPVASMSPYAQYIVMRMAHQQGAKVLLDGQGADEIFAGYPYYYSYYFYELFRGFEWYSLIKEMYEFVHINKSIYPHAMFAYLLLPDSVKRLAWKRLMNTWINHDFLTKECGKSLDPRLKRMDLNGVLTLTLYSTSIPKLLRWEDKNSMRWGIETRPPFLDVELVEFAFSLPSEKKLRSGKRKIIFTETMGDILPAMIRNRNDKIGFQTPVDDVFRDAAMIDFCKSIIYSDSFKNRPYWNWFAVEKLFKKHLDNKTNAGDIIWKWVNLELWLREYFDKTVTSCPI